MPDDRREYQSIFLPVSFGGLHCRNGPFEDTDFVDLHHNRMQCILQTGRNLLLRDPHRISGNGIWRYPVYRNPGPGILYVCLFMQYIVFPSICDNTRRLGKDHRDACLYKCGWPIWIYVCHSNRNNGNVFGAERGALVIRTAVCVMFLYP